MDTDWFKLNNFLKEHQHKKKVSISGGGDSLFKFEEKKDWWNKIFELCQQYHLKIDVHTREKLTNDYFWKKINRCVASCDELEDDIDFLKYILSITKLRVTKVITKTDDDKKIKKFIYFSKTNNCQLTFKQLYGFEKAHNDRYLELKNKYPECFFLDHGDYNLYFMPDNSIRESFL